MPGGRQHRHEVCPVDEAAALLQGNPQGHPDGDPYVQMARATAAHHDGLRACDPAGGQEGGGQAHLQGVVRRQHGQDARLPAE